jgi:hypothetical protein
MNARRRWSPDEKKEAVRLSKEGFTYKEIAERLRPGVKSAYRSIGEIVREERSGQAIQPTSPQATSTPLSIPGRPSSTIQLPSEMSGSLTAHELMHMMDDDQKRLFINTYKDLRGDADEESLTKAENEMLIRCSYSNVKYLRAQALLSTAENYLMMEMEGHLTDSDTDKAKKRFAGGRESYKKEVEQWHKEYMELLNDLKLTRKQRLDKIKDTRNTFLDLQLQLTEKARRESIVDDVKRINRATDEELRRMAAGEVGPDGQRHPWLVGAFDEYLEAPLNAKPPQLEQTGDDDVQESN